MALNTCCRYTIITEKTENPEQEREHEKKYQENSKLKKEYDKKNIQKILNKKENMKEAKTQTIPKEKKIPRKQISGKS